MSVFGDRLFDVIISENLSFSEAGKISNVNGDYISKYVSGRVENPRADIVCKLAKGLNVSADYLLGLSNKKKIADAGECIGENYK